MKIHLPWVHRRRLTSMEDRFRRARDACHDAEDRAARSSKARWDHEMRLRDKELRLGELAMELRLLAVRIDRGGRSATPWQERVGFSVEVPVEVIEGYRRENLLYNAIAAQVEYAFLTAPRRDSPFDIKETPA